MTATLPGQVAPPGPRPPATHRTPVRRRERLLLAAVVLALLAGTVLRLLSSGPLWLDESISVEIAHRSWPAMVTALRHDGSPPLYYVLLHLWIDVFGTGTVAVRAMSSLFAVASLPLAWWAGMTVGGRRLAVPALLLTAASPWALRYATETRMYTLELDLVLLGLVLVPRALARPSWPRLAGVCVLTAALAYTHYWTLYLLFGVACWLLLHRRWRVLGAMVSAVVLFAPWLSNFFFQVRHTGTPWAAPPGIGIVVSTITQWGGSNQIAPVLGVAMLLLALLGLWGLRRRAGTSAGTPDGPSGGNSVLLDLSGLPGTRALAAFALTPLIVAVVVGQIVSGGGFAVRYTGIDLPFYVLLMARGISLLPGRRLAVGTLGVVVVLGLINGAGDTRESRTQAGAVARSILATAVPGDVVLFCPDQLGPAVSRLLPASLGLHEIAYADPEGPALVDWVDYAARVTATSPASVEGQALAAAGPGHQVLLVMQPGYRIWGEDCEQVAAGLTGARGEPYLAVASDTRVFEHESLLVFPAVTGTG